MENNLSIAKAGKEDIPAIVTLINSAYHGEPASASWTSEGNFMLGQRTSAADISPVFDQPGTDNFKCCTTAGDIVGFVSLEQQEHFVYLGLLSVAPRMQAAGIGRRLLEFAEAYAASNHKPAIYITVVNIRAELVAWYQRRGYTPTGKTTPFPHKHYTPNVTLHLVEMKKEVIN